MPLSGEGTTPSPGPTLRRGDRGRFVGGAMSAERVDQVATFCPMCVSRCGATATVVDGRLTAIGPDPAHPPGPALCGKGEAAPRIIEHPDRLRHPLRRTHRKGAPDPGWEQISWDVAL